MKRHGTEVFEFHCTRLQETANAVLVEERATGNEIWIPLSQVEELSFDEHGEGTVIMTAWIAKKKGLL